MVKKEKSTSDSDDDVNPLPSPTSTQKTTPVKEKRVLQKSDDDDSEYDAYQANSQESSLSNPQNSLAQEEYFNKYPNVKPSKPKYSVDVDLSDSGDEIWIVKCPTSINAKKVLLGAKFEKVSNEAVSTIITQQDNCKLEGVMTKNECEKPVTIMSGTEFKSFVPVGTIQIREALEIDELPSISQLAEDDEEEIQLPEGIDKRHPLLGVDYKAAQKMPKRVKKTLSLAQQRSQFFYLQKNLKSEMENEESKATVTPSKKGGKAKKRKCEEMVDYFEGALPDEAIKRAIKREALSPPPSKKAHSEVPVEDDLSWLKNM